MERFNLGIQASEAFAKGIKYAIETEQDEKAKAELIALARHCCGDVDLIAHDSVQIQFAEY